MYELTPGAPHLPIETPGGNQRNTRNGKDTQREHVTIFTFNAGLAVELKETEYHLPKAKGTWKKYSGKRKRNKKKSLDLFIPFLMSNLISFLYNVHTCLLCQHNIPCFGLLAPSEYFSHLFLCSRSTGQSKQFQELRAALQGCSGDTDDGTITRATKKESSSNLHLLL